MESRISNTTESQEPQILQREPKSKKQWPAMRCLAVAPSNYGKSTLIADFIIESVKQGRWKAQRILIFSPTHKSDPEQLRVINFCKTKKSDFLEKNCFTHLDGNEAMLLELFDAQQTIKDLIAQKQSKVKLHHFLIVMDDVIGESVMTQKRGALDKIATQGRHYNISTILSLQGYRSTMSPVMRAQFSQIWIGRLLAVGEIEDLLSQYSQGLGETKKEALKNMMHLWEEAIQKRNGHGFLCIDAYVQYGQGRLRLGDPFTKSYD